MKNATIHFSVPRQDLAGVNAHKRGSMNEMGQVLCKFGAGLGLGGKSLPAWGGPVEGAS